MTLPRAQGYTLTMQETKAQMYRRLEDMARSTPGGIGEICDLLGTLALEAELAEAKRDSERLDWLNANAYFGGICKQGVGDIDWRRDIDTAIESERGEGERDVVTVEVGGIGYVMAEEYDEVCARLAQLEKVEEAAREIKRGCDCEYDYRCGRCGAVIRLLDALAAAAEKEG